MIDSCSGSVLVDKPRGDNILKRTGENRFVIITDLGIRLSVVECRPLSSKCEQGNNYAQVTNQSVGQPTASSWRLGWLLDVVDI